MLVVDTSVLLAAADNADPDRESCVRAIEDASPFLTTAFVIAEAAHLNRRQLGAKAEAAFFRALAAGEIQVKLITPAMPSESPAWWRPTPTSGSAAPTRA